MINEDIIRNLDNSAKVFDVLNITINFSIPYTLVFFQLKFYIKMPKLK